MESTYSQDRWRIGLLGFERLQVQINSQKRPNDTIFGTLVSFVRTISMPFTIYMPEAMETKLDTSRLPEQRYRSFEASHFTRGRQADRRELVTSTPKWPFVYSSNM